MSASRLAPPRRPGRRPPPARARRSAPGPRWRPAAARARRALKRVPTAAWVCAAIAIANAACWSLITPPFLALDEPDHFAYVQGLAEAGRLPSSAESEFSPEEQVALRDLRHAQVRFRPAGQTIASAAEQRTLLSDLAQSPSRLGPGGAGVAASEPPLYYALAAIPYTLGSGGSILDRLELMRLLSALLAGVTALFAFLFVRESLPSTRWAWTVGGLGVALSPLLGFSSSTVNPDALLFALAAALFYCLARAFRRGLSTRLVLAIGGIVAAGLCTKLNFLGLVPGAILGLALLARRQARAQGSRVYARTLAPAVAIALSPGVAYGLVNLASGHRTFGIASAGLASAFGGRSLGAELTYAWEFYLPRLPFMHSDFAGVSTTRQVWFRDVVGLYGWGDTPFPGWVYGAAIAPALALAALCARGLALGRRALRERLAALLVYASMALGLLALVAAAGYLQYPGTAIEFADARYLLPLVALWGVVLALAARGAGRRLGPAVGALLIALVLAHDLFSQLQVIARYYG